MPLITAHNGCEKSPVDTLHSIYAAADADADIIEIDVRATKDNVAVLMHDSHVTTNTNGRILLRDITFEQLIDLEKNDDIVFTSPESCITSLQEALCLIRSQHRIANLDVKDSYSIEALVRTVKSENMVDSVIVTGCEKDQAAYIRRFYPEFQVLLNVGDSLPEMKDAEYREFIKTVCSDVIETSCHGVNLCYKYCKSGLVDYARLKHIPVFVWTVDNTMELKRYIDMDIHSITTNKPRELHRLIYGV
jgi:glycerophosphoryl diester phosphodiesterase